MALLRFAATLRVTLSLDHAAAYEVLDGALCASPGTIFNTGDSRMTRYSPRLLRASPEIKAFIKSFETLRLRAYDDGTGVMTIGWGHTKGVQTGQVITRTIAEDWFRGDLHVAEGTIRLAIKAPLYQHEYDALLSFVFNIGGTQFSKSTMRERINELRYEDAADQFPRWIYANGERLGGLVKRRDQERRLWMTGAYPKA